jgi:hypothetical protein
MFPFIIVVLLLIYLLVYRLDIFKSLYVNNELSILLYNINNYIFELVLYINKVREINHLLKEICIAKLSNILYTKIYTYTPYILNNKLKEQNVYIVFKYLLFNKANEYLAKFIQLSNVINIEQAQLELVLEKKETEINFYNLQTSNDVSIVTVCVRVLYTELYNKLESELEFILTTKFNSLKKIFSTSNILIYINNIFMPINNNYLIKCLLEDEFLKSIFKENISFQYKCVKKYTILDV